MVAAETAVASPLAANELALAAADVALSAVVATAVALIQLCQPLWPQKFFALLAPFVAVLASAAAFEATTAYDVASD